MAISKLNMNELIASIVNGLNFQLSEINAKITWGDLPECYGDINQINQLLSNLLTNAIKELSRNNIYVVGEIE